MARLAFILHRDGLGTSEERLGRILTFFAVPWESVSLVDLSKATPQHQQPYVVFGSAETLGAATAMPVAAVFLREAVALYAYATENREMAAAAISTLTGAEWRWWSPSQGPVSVKVTNGHSEFAGPMSGVTVATELAAADGGLALQEIAGGDAVGPAQTSTGRFEPIVSIGAACAFGLFSSDGPPTYICASATMVDIDQPVRGNYYDIKDHFLSAVPLVMFITWAFREVMWRPRELGACLIIDDPLLKEQYGFCDFRRLRDAMQAHGFTTNIAFIPWNWRRTSAKGSAFFRREAALFSVSIHGCDHVAAEFGATSSEVIDRRARLALARMRAHQARTQIQHEPIMVFPQGVFSAECPAVLKRNGFVAAVNTEISPADDADRKTLVRDAWDVAILSYGSFAIYTRRYQHHGIENFAFDSLLGKPCFIVAHHDAFRDEGAALVGFVDRLGALNCTFTWRSPWQVVRRAYRRRNADGPVTVRMYGTEVLLDNRDSHATEFQVCRNEGDPSRVARVTMEAHDNGSHDIRWSHASGDMQFSCVVPPGGEALVKIGYHSNVVPQRQSTPVGYGLAVAARRIASEFRDEYVQRLYGRSTNA